MPKTELKTENLEALKKGIVNLEAHIENLQQYGAPCVVAINAFDTDTKAELDYIADFCRQKGAEFALSEVFAKGADGGVELAQKIIETVETKKSEFKLLYPDEYSIKEKLDTIARKIYGADGVNYTKSAERQIKRLTEFGFADMPVCVAKTQYSLSDDMTKLGRPAGFEITIKEVRVSAGAGFIVALAGDILTMPGLPKVPAANNIDIADDGEITGLF